MVLFLMLILDLVIYINREKNLLINNRLEMLLLFLIKNWIIFVQVFKNSLMFLNCKLLILRWVKLILLGEDLLFYTRRKFLKKWLKLFIRRHQELLLLRLILVKLQKDICSLLTVGSNLSLDLMRNWMTLNVRVHRKVWQKMQRR